MTDARVGRSASQAAAPAVAATGLILAAACLCQLLVTLDASVVNVAIPSIAKALHFNATELPWVVDAYTLALGGLLLVGGRIADLVGYRTAMLSALGLFGVASVLGGLAQNPAELIAARAAQGVAGALLAPISLTVIMVTFTEGSARHKAISTWAMVSAGGSAVGVLLGGLLTDVLTWRWVLFINVPIIAVVIVLAVRAVPENRPEHRAGLDILGALLVTASMTLVVFGAIEAARYGWGSSRTVLSLIGGAVLMVLFLGWERQVPAPIVRLQIFATRTVWLANVVILLIGAATIVGFYFSSLFLQNVLHYSPLAAGASFLPFCFGIASGSMTSRKISARFGNRATLTFGLVLGALGIYLFSRLSPASTFMNGFLIPSLVASYGIGVCMVANTTMGTSGAAPGEAGLVSGLINASRQIGGSVGLAVLSTIAVSAAHGVDRAHALTAGYDRAFEIGAGVLLLAALVAAVATPTPASTAAAAV